MATLVLTPTPSSPFIITPRAPSPFFPIAAFRRPSLAVRSSPPFRPLYVSEAGAPALPSADALAAAIRRASPNSPVEVSRRTDMGGGDTRLAAPTPDFRRLCLEQLDLFRAVVHPTAVISVYMRLAGSYVIDQLELHRVFVYPEGISESAISVAVVATFSVPAGLRATEAALLKQQVDVFPEHGAVVLPMVKHPFVVGFLVAEIPFMDPETAKPIEDDGSRYMLKPSTDKLYRLPQLPDRKFWELQSLNHNLYDYHQFTEEQKSRALLIARSLAMAYIIDQRAVLLQQSSWQNNVRMSHLVEQIRAPLSNIRTLTNMLSVHAKRSEISFDIIEDILVQGHHMKETLQQLQDAVYFTKANIVRYNDEALKKLHDPAYSHLESSPSLSTNSLGDDVEHKNQKTKSMIAWDSTAKDSQMPMPPLVLAPQQRNIRPCDVSEVLEELVGAAGPLAAKQKRLIELKENLLPLKVAVEEPALRQALSNLIEGALLRTHVGGKVQIFASGALAGGILVLIDDDGPDMQYMTQMHSLTPFGVDLFSSGMVQDNMTWNFVAGLAVSREILEGYGCVLRVVSPRTSDVALGTGGTRIELWLPTFGSEQIGSLQES